MISLIFNGRRDVETPPLVAVERSTEFVTRCGDYSVVKLCPGRRTKNDYLFSKTKMIIFFLRIDSRQCGVSALVTPNATLKFLCAALGLVSERTSPRANSSMVA